MSSFKAESSDLKCINTIRTVAVDVVNKANSGHPGAPMGMAPVTHVLLSRFFRCNPKNSKWPNRDRFVLSNGHGCVLQYTFLHLLGYDVTMDDLKSFRQLDSRTPGHPEVGVTDGIEVTTGPLGQGISNAVGLAIAQEQVAGTFNRDGFELFNNYTYAFAGDGCMQEGVASEACSLAGHLQLGRLICIYDDNHVSIDGNTNVSFTEDVMKRFEAYGWHTQHVDKGDDDLSGIYNAIVEAQKVTDKPSIIRLRTTIGFGSKLAGTGGVHGNPLKPDDVEQLKTAFGFDPKEFFVVPDETKKAYAAIGEKGAKLEAEWNDLVKSYNQKFPEEGKDLARRLEGKLPEGWEKALPVYKPTDPAVASRKLSETVLTKLAPVVPELICGSADLTGSNLTRWKDAVDFQPESTGLGKRSGRYFRFGVREHGMGAIMNGIAAYGNNLIIPSAGTFLNFVSYAAGAVRLSALSHFRVIYIATHDSIGLGEDGPTHQPVEVLGHFRSLPNCMVHRPADGNETSACYLLALSAPHTPSIIALSRQNLPQLENSTIENAVRGAYVVHDPAGGKKADVCLVSTGSEVGICVEAVAELSKKGLEARVVSMPCCEVFDVQSKEYKLKVLPDGVPIVSVEAASSFGWAKYSHAHHAIDTFGASGPYKEVYKKYKMTGPDIAAAAETTVNWYKEHKVTIISPINAPLSV